MKRTNRNIAAQPRTVLYLSGEIDLATAPSLRERLARAAATPFGDVVIDLSEVTFMDCSALGLLVEARARLQDRLWLRDPPRPVVRLLRLTGLQATFALVPALASVEPEPPIASPTPAVRHREPRGGGTAATGMIPGPSSDGGRVGHVVPVARPAFRSPARTANVSARR